MGMDNVAASRAFNCNVGRRPHPNNFKEVMCVHPRPLNYAKSYAHKFLVYLRSIAREELCDILRDLEWFKETVDDIQATYHCSSRRCTPANLDRKILFAGRTPTGRSDFSGVSRLSA